MNILAPKRGVAETFEEYQARRRLGRAELKHHARGQDFFRSVGSRKIKNDKGEDETVRIAASFSYLKETGVTRKVARAEKLKLSRESRRA